MRGDDVCHRVRRLLHVVEHRHHCLRGFRRRNEFENRLGDDSEGTFGGDHQPRQIEARDAFYRARTRLYDVAFRVEKFEPHNVVFCHSVFEPAQPARVFCDVAADCRDGLRTGVWRVEEVFLRDSRCEFRRYHPRLDHRVEVGRVDFDDTVELLREDYDRFGRVGNCAAREVCARAANRHRQTVLVAERDYLSELFRCLGGDHERGGYGVEHGGVVGVRLSVGDRRKNVFRADDFFEIFSG